MDVEFEEFFQYIEKNLSSSSEKEIKNVLKPLKYLMWKQQLKKFLKISLLFISICCAIYYIDTLNWYFCAVTRILMIKLLPLWNWKYLGRSRCLIEKAQSQSSSTAAYVDSNDVLNVKDCRACEHFGKVFLFLEYPIAHTQFRSFSFFSRAN